jgi:hypothetical protein
MSKKVPLHELIKTRLKVGAVIKVEEPDLLKGYASAVKACEDLGIKVRTAFTPSKGVDAVLGNPDLAITPLVETDECLVVSDMLLALSKDFDVMAIVRNIATRMGIPKGKHPRVIFVEQMDAGVPEILARDIEIIPNIPPIRREVEAELDSFLAKNKGVVLEGNGTLPKAEKEEKAERPSRKR